MVTEEARRINERLAAEIKPKRIYLFGSYAKDMQRSDSDYDFYLVMPDDSGNEIETAQRAYRTLRGVRKTPVDIVVGKESTFENRKEQPTVEREVFREGVLLYAE